MERIKIKFVDFWPGFDIEQNDFYQILSKKYEIEFSDEPDFLFYSVFGVEYLNYNCIKIFYTGENIVPDFNSCDYGIGFNYLTFDKRYLRMPLYNLFKYKRFLELSMKIHEEEFIKREKFCNFIYSNGGADKRREEFFKLLSKYKKIDSGGRYLNNIGGPVEDKFSFQKQYKFSIAFENSSDIGYTTEKLIEAKAAGTIPIYWGNPEVAKEFNSKSFINCHEYNSFEDVIKEIKRIDNDDELYMSYYRTPFSKNNKLVEENQEKLEQFLYFIIEKKEKMRKSPQIIGMFSNEGKYKRLLRSYRCLRENIYIRIYIKVLKILKLFKEI